MFEGCDTSNQLSTNPPTTLTHLFECGRGHDARGVRRIQPTVKHLDHIAAVQPIGQCQSALAHIPLVHLIGGS